MKKIIVVIAMFLSGYSLIAQSTDVQGKEITKSQIIEASCGQCNFGLTSKKGCDLAVRIDGKAYWVEGTDIHSHGDAHGKEGFCSAVRKADVVGEIVDGKFKVSEFKLLPMESSHDNREGHKH